MRHFIGLAPIVAALLLAGCGGGGSDTGGSTTTDNSGSRGSLQYNPPLRVTGLSASDFQTQLSASATGKGLLAVAGTPKCGVNFHYIQYGTVGGAGEATNGTGALMVPTGTDPACSGARPIVLYAHGTTTAKAYNIANILDSSNDAYGESALVAAAFAAQGFIVVAPNYAGYDASKLTYHPYLNADQESKDMIDALTAARTALPNVGGTDSGKLFITGYSQGGQGIGRGMEMHPEYAPDVKLSAVAFGGTPTDPAKFSRYGSGKFFSAVNFAASAGLPRISPPRSTVVSAVITSVAASTVPTATDFATARRRT